MTDWKDFFMLEQMVWIFNPWKNNSKICPQTFNLEAFPQLINYGWMHDTKDRGRQTTHQLGVFFRLNKKELMDFHSGVFYPLIALDPASH